MSRRPLTTRPANPILADVVERLVAAAQRSGLTWTEVAAAAGVHPNTLYHLRKGRHAPGAERKVQVWITLRSVAQALGLPETALLPRLPAPRTPGEAVQQAILAAGRDGATIAQETGLAEGLVYQLCAGTYPCRMTAQVRVRLLRALPALAASPFFNPPIAPPKETSA